MSNEQIREPDDTGHDEAQQAADSLKDQIAKVRARIRDARETLREHARRAPETKTFKR